MYTSFFKMKQNPFEVSPDPQFFVSLEAHDEALAGLHYGIRAHKGFMVLTGEVGTGKTLVVRRLLDLLDRQKLPYAYVFCNQLSGCEFLSSVAVDLGITGNVSGKSGLLKQFQEFLLSRGQQGLYTALIVDEAQNLSPEVLEEIRLLTNMETARGKLLQIVLIGQPELDVILEAHNMRQLKQRIALRFHLPPLTEVQTRGYIWDRLSLAGARDPIFGRSTIHRVFVYSGGLPRLINIICDNALISTFALGLARVPDEIVDEVARDLRLMPIETGPLSVSPSPSVYPAPPGRPSGPEFSETPAKDKDYQGAGHKA